MCCRLSLTAVSTTDVLKVQFTLRPSILLPPAVVFWNNLPHASHCDHFHFSFVHAGFSFNQVLCRYLLIKSSWHVSVFEPFPILRLSPRLYSSFFLYHSRSASVSGQSMSPLKSQTSSLAISIARSVHTVPITTIVASCRCFSVSLCSSRISWM